MTDACKLSSASEADVVIPPLDRVIDATERGRTPDAQARVPAADKAPRVRQGSEPGAARADARPPKAPGGSARIDFANTLRGFAAFAVMISHYCGFWGPARDQIAAMITVPALPLEAYGVPEYAKMLVALPILSLPAFGVALFFVISGFVIPFSMQKLNWAGFTVNRIFRIVPTYIVGFSLTLFSLFVGTRYFSCDWPYSAKEVLIHYIPGVRDILWSRHIDFIVWTLEIEMKFYLLCAILISWFRRCSMKLFLAPVILFALALLLDRMIPSWERSNATLYRLAMTYVTSSQYLIFMFIGSAFHYLYRGRITPEKAYLGIGGLFALFCIHGWAGPYSSNLGIAWSYGFAVLTFAFAYAYPKWFKANPLFDFLADVSYPLYVIHAISGFMVLRILANLGLPAWLTMIVTISGCLFVSWILHVLVEHPTQMLGKQLGLKLTGNSLSKAAPRQA